MARFFLCYIYHDFTHTHTHTHTHIHTHTYIYIYWRVYYFGSKLLFKQVSLPMMEHFIIFISFFLYSVLFFKCQDRDGKGIVSYLIYKLYWYMRFSVTYFCNISNINTYITSRVHVFFFLLMQLSPFNLCLLFKKQTNKKQMNCVWDRCNEKKICKTNK